MRIDYISRVFLLDFWLRDSDDLMWILTGLLVFAMIKILIRIWGNVILGEELL